MPNTVKILQQVEPRDVAPFLGALRNFLLGRKLKTTLRYQDRIAARTQPPPHLPEGPSHRLANNYYCSRDGRREAKPPTVVAENMKGTLKLIEAGEFTSAKTTEKKAQFPTPGKPYEWQLSEE